MITTTIQEIEQRQVTFRTREQAARLLEELRDLYQSLSRDEQNHIREHLSSVANSQSLRFIQGEEF
jgi:hypothetical protein